MMLHVLDLSSYQDRIDWQRVRASNPDLFAVYVKKTEGSSYTNPRWREQVRGAQSVGFAVGSYHFARPGVGSGKAQADFFVSQVSRRPLLRPMLDLETNALHLPPRLLWEWIIEFSDRLKQKRRCRPLLYFSPSFFRDRIVGGIEVADLPLLREHPIWLAEYGPKLHVPPPLGHVALWQHTQTLERPGIVGAVDDSYLYDQDAIVLRRFGT